jgi:hypothetical protein
MEANLSSFAVQKAGQEEIGDGAFAANFCNASGMFAYISVPTGCVYQPGPCDEDGWRNSKAFLGFVGDMTFTLLVDGISPKAVPVSGPSDEVVWVDRTPTCSNRASRDVNVNLAADNSLLGWSRGSTLYDKDHTCSVTNVGRTITQFVPKSDIDSAKVEAFVAKRIAAKKLSCKPFEAA